MLLAKYTCPSGWTGEYYGYLMAECWNHNRSQYTCVDSSLMFVVGSAADRDGVLFYPVEGRCGSLPYPPELRSFHVLCVPSEFTMLF